MTSKDRHKEWTVMVYLATESTLAQENVFNLTEMKRVGGSLNNANVIAWLETGPAPNEGIPYRLTGPTPSGSNEEPTHASARYYYKQGLLQENIDHHLLGHFNGHCKMRSCTEKSSGTTQKLTGTGYERWVVEFVKASIAHYQARHYALILSGHGQGWVGDFMMQGDDGRGALKLSDLKKMLVEAWGEPKAGNERVDILGMDSCLMSMTEVCYEVQGHAK